MAAIDNYLNKISPAEKEALERIRRIIHTTVPEAEEVISYGMPGFKYKGKYLAGFNAFKDHLSFFPTSSPVEAFKDQLEDFELSTGTVQFTVEHPIPESVIKDMVLYRVANIEKQ